MNSPNKIEAAVLEMLLAGDHPAATALRPQLGGLRVTSREFSGVGFFTEFAQEGDPVHACPPLSLAFGDVVAEIDGLPHGAGFVLFVEKGFIVMLEGYTYGGEAWPDDPGRFSLSYWPPERDLGTMDAAVVAANRAHS